MHTAITCIHLRCLRMGLGVARRHAALRRHPSTSCGEWVGSGWAAVPRRRHPGRTLQGQRVCVDISL
jgi:hypothetical protein